VGMMAEPKADVSPPQRKPRRGGIKSVVGEFVSAERLGAANALQWISDGCEFPKAAPGLCYSPTPVTGDKTFVGIDHGTGPIFGLYQGVECYLGANTDYEDRARALLEQGEGRGVEEVLWEYANTAGGTGPAQTSWVAAIGQMDEAADTLYLGQPVIMLSRFAAVQARAAKAILGDEETGRLWTANGTPVIATSAAPDNVAVVMGWPTIYASEITAVRARNHVVNQELAIAERLYGIAIDCEWALHYAVTVAAADPQNPDPDEPLEMNLGSIPSSPIPDGTDTTIIVQTNVAPQNEVVLWFAVNGGTPVAAGEMTETGSHEFVWNVIGDSTTAGDAVEVWAVSEFDGAPVESNRIVIEVT
jgi:hypothetical protein